MDQLLSGIDPAKQAAIRNLLLRNPFGLSAAERTPGAEPGAARISIEYSPSVFDPDSHPRVGLDTVGESETLRLGPSAALVRVAKFTGAWGVGDGSEQVGPGAEVEQQEEEGNA